MPAASSGSGRSDFHICHRSATDWNPVYRLQSARVVKRRASLEEKNPLRVLNATYLSLIFIAAQYLVTFARGWFGNAGMFGSAGVLGSVDIDAAVASLAPMVRQGMEPAEAARVIAFGILGNTSVKCAMVLIWGKSAFRKSTFLGFVCMLTALTLSLIFTRQ